MTKIYDNITELIGQTPIVKLQHVPAESADAVSYTHLDVYKRQVLSFLWTCSYSQKANTNSNR